MRLRWVAGVWALVLVGCGPEGSAEESPTDAGAAETESEDAGSDGGLDRDDGHGDADHGDAHDDDDADDDDDDDDAVGGSTGGDEPAQPQLCRAPGCEGLECATSTNAAALLADFMEVVQERGFSSVFVPNRAEMRGADWVIDYVLVRPGAEARRWNELAVGSSTPDDVLFNEEIDLWSPLWLDEDLVFADEDDIRFELDRCYSGLGAEYNCYSWTVGFEVSFGEQFWDDTQCESTWVDVTIDPLTGDETRCDVEYMGDQCGGTG